MAAETTTTTGGDHGCEGRATGVDRAGETDGVDTARAYVPAAAVREPVGAWSAEFATVSADPARTT